MIEHEITELFFTVLTRFKIADKYLKCNLLLNVNEQFTILNYFEN